MSLTRKFLSALGIEADKVDEIIIAHTETVNALKEERENYKAEAEKYKAEAEKIPVIQKELDAVKEAAENNPDAAYKEQYDALKKEYDAYKADVENRETKAKKTDAYTALLKKAGIQEKRIPVIIKVSQIDKIEFDKDGNVKNADELEKSIKEEWSEFIPKEKTEGAHTSTPPEGKPGDDGMTKESIMAIKDRAERQKAISEHHNLFGY